MLVLLVVLVVIAIAASPNFNLHPYGYYPSGIGGLLILLVLAWRLLGHRIR